MAGSGSAPLPPGADLAGTAGIGLKLYEGYGMTEDNCAMSHSSNADACRKPGCVGVAHARSAGASLSAEGEIQIKSPGPVQSATTSSPNWTAESFTSKTASSAPATCGEFCAPTGMLKITGRTKELFKTAKGKYVAPAPIENLINAHSMIELSMVSGVGHPAAYAIVLLSEQLRPRQTDPQVRAEVQSELSQLLDQVNASVADYEQLKMIVVAREPWTIENGLLTPTMKIKRAKIEKALEPEVERWYADKQKVLWQ